MLKRYLEQKRRLIATARRIIQTNYLILFTVSLLLILFVLTLAATNALIVSRDELSENAYQQRINEDKITIERSMGSYAQIISSGVGLLDSVEVTPEVWQRYIESYKKVSALPDVYMFGVTELVDRSDIPLMERRLSQLYGRQVKVLPDSAEQSKASVVIYVERGDRPAKSLGLNLMAFEERAEIFNAATQTGEVVLGDVPRIASGSSIATTLKHPALMFAAPYYGRDAGSARANADGHIYLTLDSQQTFATIFKDTDLNGSTLNIYLKDSQEETALYRSPGRPASGLWSEPVTTELSIYGRDYELEYMFNRRAILSPLQIYAPILTFVAGAMLSLSVPALIHIFIRSRQNSLRLASERRIKQAQDELLSLASHQLRTPATATKQYMGMVLQGFAGDISRTQKDLLSKAYDSNERQLRVINDILHVAKLDAGRIIPSMQDFNITDLVKGVIEDYSSDLRAADMKLSRRLGRAMTLHGDQYMIRMIIENLVSNAIKYSTPGGKIEIVADRSGATYRLSIKDTGVGIAKKDIDKLFKQFSRIPNERTGQVTGTGVGLYLAQNLASLHGGKIIVESKEHKGSTFTLELPKKL